MTRFAGFKEERLTRFAGFKEERLTWSSTIKGGGVGIHFSLLYGGGMFTDFSFEL